MAIRVLVVAAVAVAAVVLAIRSQSEGGPPPTPDWIVYDTVPLVTTPPTTSVADRRRAEVVRLCEDLERMRVFNSPDLVTMHYPLGLPGDLRVEARRQCGLDVTWAEEIIREENSFGG